MSSYLVLDTEVLDQEAYSEFATKFRDALVASGGTFLVRGGEIEVVEGDWRPQRIVIMAFDDDEAAGQFIRSAEYTALQELRARAVRSKVLVVEGYSG